MQIARSYFYYSVFEINTKDMQQITAIKKL